MTVSEDCESTYRHEKTESKTMNQRDEGSSGDKPEEKFVPLDAITRVEKEDGRWVVYLNVPSWNEDEENPITNHWKKINDYSTESEAKVAASWFERSANKTIRPPTGF